MRHTYELSKETIKVLTGNVVRIAEEMEVNDKYLYAILAGTETDTFAKFRSLYAACVRAKAPVCHWNQELDAIRARYEKNEPVHNPVECLTKKIHTDAQTTEKMVMALKDGEIDEREARKILQAIEEERKVLDLIETMMQFRSLAPAAEVQAFNRQKQNGRAR